MYIKKIRKFEKEYFFEKLKQVTLLNQENKLPYSDSNFEIRIVKPQDFQPSSLYVLKSKLSFLFLLMNELAKQVGGFKNIDTLFEYQDKFGFWNQVIPPIVELTDFREWMILDGQHRSFIAIHQKIEIAMVFIKNVKYPFPCLPLPKKWNSLEIVDKIPEHKRVLRKGLNDTAKTRYSLHRDLRKLGSKGTRKILF